MKLQEFIFRALSLAIAAVTVLVNIHLIKTTIIHVIEAARSSQSLMMLILGAALIVLTCAGFSLGRNAKVAPENVSRQMNVLTEESFNTLLALESRRSGRSEPVAFAGRVSDPQLVRNSDSAKLPEQALPAVVSATRAVGSAGGASSAGWYGSRSAGVISVEPGGIADQADDAASDVAATGALPPKVVISISEGVHSLSQIAQSQAVEQRRAEEFAASSGERTARPPLAKTSKAFACSSEAVG